MSSPFCEPDCKNRKPGCQDHCERYKKVKTAWDKHREKERRESAITNYVIGEIRKNQRR